MIPTKLTRAELSNLITALDGDIDSRTKEADMARGYAPPDSPPDLFEKECRAAIAQAEALRSKLLNLR